MKTKTQSLVSILIVFTILDLNAQTDVDAFRYSDGSITGTARYSAMSGAFGALGGDFTTLSYNPAGIAIYRTSEFSFTPSIYAGSNTSNFLGQSNKEIKYNFNIGNTGLIFTRKLSNDENSPGWKSWNFGIGYNRLNNFHNRSFYEGVNPSNSLLDHFAETATGTIPDNLDDYYESLAYNAYLINPDASNNYNGVIPAGQEIQRKTTETRGTIGETVFTFGGIYSNKFYFGGTLGFKNLRYVDYTSYEEQDPDTLIPYFNRFNFQQDLTTTGSGFDMKFGMIYKANDIVRLGMAFETPTWYTMHDEYKNSMIGYLDTGVAKFYSAESPDGSFDYDLNTPFKAMGSIAIIFGASGLLSADYEFSDYSDARFSATGSSFSSVNSSITRKYSEIHSLRIGTEWLYENISFRGGAAFSSSPLNEIYKAGSSDFSKKSFSGGIGFRENNVFLDFGYVYTMSDQFYQPYTLSFEKVPGVKSRVIGNNFLMTLKVKF